MAIGHHLENSDPLAIGNTFFYSFLGSM